VLYEGHPLLEERAGVRCFTRGHPLLEERAGVRCFDRPGPSAIQTG